MARSNEEILRVVAENQKRFFNQIADEHLLALLRSNFGPDYNDRIADAIVKTGRNSILFDMAGVQPFNAPIGLLLYKTLRDPTVDVFTAEPELLGTDTVAIQAETRRLTTVLDLSRSELDHFISEVFDLGTISKYLEKCFNRAWSEIEREVLSHLYDPAISNISVRRDKLREDLHRLICSTADRATLGPADALLMSKKTFDAIKPNLANTSFIPSNLELEPTVEPDPDDRPMKAAILDSWIHIYTDVKFFDDRIIAFRKPKHNFDNTIIWSPYLFSGSGFTQDRLHEWRLVFRGKVTLLSTDMLAQGEIV